jgi:hypothetical protein
MGTKKGNRKEATFMADQMPQATEAEAPQANEKEKMCCEGGMTAAEHRAKSPDGKCCTD